MAQWDYLFRETEAPKAKDVGPEARRAAAGRPPGPREMTDEEAGIPSRLDMGDQRALPKAPPDLREPGSASGVPAIGDTAKFRHNAAGEVMRRPATELESDPIAQGITAAAMAAPLGPLSRFLGAPASAAVTNAAASKMSGGSALSGAAIGFVPPAFRSTLASLGEDAIRARGDARLMQALGEGAGERGRNAMERLGAKTMADTAREFGIAGAPDKRIPLAAGLDQVGGQIHNAYATLDAAGASDTLGSQMRNLQSLRDSMSGTAAGKKLGDVIYSKMEDLWQHYGADPAAKIPLSVLNKEIGDLERTGFGASGASLPTSVSAKLARQMASTMDAGLKARLAEAAQDPNLAGVVRSIEQANPKYRALLILKRIADKTEPQKAFETTGSRLSQTLSHLPAKAAGATGRAVDAIPAATDRALGQMYDTVPGADKLRSFVERGAGAAAQGSLPLSIAKGLRDGDADAQRAGLAKELFGR